MRIAVLTLPLNTNYGGILQAYALQMVLKRLGHDVRLIYSDIFPSDVPRRFPKRRRIAVYAKRFIYRYLLRKDIVVRPDYEVVKRYEFISRYIQPFIDKHIQYVRLEEILREDTDCVDAIVVGSDQVWRRAFTGDAIVHYFLDFLEYSKIKRIAYAASFGSDEWEFTEKETVECAALSQKFDLITVREANGVDFCKEYLGVEAEHVLDPTLLLGKSYYVNLVECEEEPQSEGRLFYYILDDALEKKTLVEKAAKELNLVPFTRMPKQRVSSKSFVSCSFDDDCCYPSVTSWLRAFMDAEFVVTDSFHGCVFSIIFNKPFYVVGNKERGMARFDSLLQMFGLASRLIDLKDVENIKFNGSIDWERVNAVREDYKQKSLNLLTDVLKDK